MVGLFKKGIWVDWFASGEKKNERLPERLEEGKNECV
jgi:hypothetical protein